MAFTRSPDVRIASVQQSHARSGCWCAGGGSSVCCRLDSHSGGTACERLWRSSNRLEHALLCSVALTCGVAARVLAASALAAAAGVTAQAALLLSSCGVHPTALSTLRFGSAVLTFLRGCSRAGGISFVRCCGASRSSGAASEQH